MTYLRSNIIDADHLKDLLEYDPSSGVFRWLVTLSNRAPASTVAGAKQKSNNNVYWGIRIYGKKYKAHVLAWIYSTGCAPSGVIDHIDGNGLNNSFDNLRDVTQTVNCQNLSRRTDNISGKTGVHWCKIKSRWVAKITVSGRRLHIGYFIGLDEAVNARCQAERNYNFHVNHGREK